MKTSPAFIKNFSWFYYMRQESTVLVYASIVIVEYQIVRSVIVLENLNSRLEVCLLQAILPAL